MTAISRQEIREITVISGKGGTGKTTLTAAFASLALPNAVLADCDVDAADLHLILKPRIGERTDFYGLKVAEIETEHCMGCGTCADACRFDAIERGSGCSVTVIHEKCEGCGVCSLVCPMDAISLVDRIDGTLFASQTRFGPMAHARLKAGGEASGKLVAQVRNKARLLAQKHRKSLIISDGPPGIGCPVISAISGTDLAVIVTEPTVSGISDLKRVLETAQHFKVPAGVIINKADVNPGKCRDIRKFCAAQSIAIPVFGELPYDMVATESMVAEQSVVEFSDGAFSERVREIWTAIRKQVDGS